MHALCRRLQLSLLAVLLAGGLHGAQAQDEEAALFAPFQSLLDEHLVVRELPDGGLVTAFDYHSALRDPDTPAQLAGQRALLASFDPLRLDRREAAIAFWLNAHNFFLLQHILETPRRDQLVTGVRAYGSLFNRLRLFDREIFEIGGNGYSLDAMRNEILLGEAFHQRRWRDTRVHFALSCAAVGCPALRAQVYDADHLDAMLTDTARRMLSTPRHLRIDEGTLHLSRMFRWHREDFAGEAGSLRDYLVGLADGAMAEEITESRRIRYMDFDWSLNRPGNFSEFRDE